LTVEYMYNKLIQTSNIRWKTIPSMLEWWCITASFKQFIQTVTSLEMIVSTLSWSCRRVLYHIGNTLQLNVRRLSITLMLHQMLIWELIVVILRLCGYSGGYHVKLTVNRYYTGWAQIKYHVNIIMCHWFSSRHWVY
jgi:hypothetical protein